MLGILVLSVLLGSMLMIIAYLLPVNAMRHNANESMKMQLEEG